LNLSVLGVLESAIAQIGDLDWASLLGLWAALADQHKVGYKSSRLLRHMYSASTRIQEFREAYAFKLLGATDLPSALETLQDSWSDDFHKMSHLLSVVQVLVTPKIKTQKVLLFNLGMYTRMDNRSAQLFPEDK
jgi:hypothetical protein